MSAGGSGNTVSDLLNDVVAVLYAALANDGVRVALGVTALSFLITPFLSLGESVAVLRLLRKETISASTVLCRAGSFLKALGLRLYMVLRILLWMLPGTAVMYAGIPLLIWTRQTMVLYLCYFAGMGLMTVLGLRAAMHYSMAELLLADHADARIRDCLHDSVLIMRRRKRYLAALYVFFIAVWIVLDTVVSMLSGVSYVLALVLQMAADLVFGLYLATTLGAFYLHYEKEPMQM